MADDLEPVFKTPRQQFLRDLLLYSGGLGLLVLIWMETGRPTPMVTPVTLAGGGLGVVVGAVLVVFGERIPWPESRLVRGLVGAVFGAVAAFVSVRLSAVLPEATGFVGLAGLFIGAIVTRIVEYVR